MITTKNRKDELRVALTSCFEQTAALAVLVIDDGSTDGTDEMVRREFPGATLVRTERSLGLIVQRNRGAQLAQTPIIFSIDDDAAFSSPHTVAQTLREFDDPRVGSVAIPFVNVQQDATIRQQPPDSDRIYTTASFIGTAHALRRELFVDLGGYREFLFHMCEEGDYCVRMLAAGYVTRLGRADPIHHFESRRRDFRRMDIYGRRNDVLYAWYNVPFPYLPVHLAGTTLNGLIWGAKVRRLGRMAWGLLRGYLAIATQFGGRKPVPGRVYQLSRRLKKRQCMPLDEIASQLPQRACEAGSR